MASTTKVGSRSENCPLLTTVRQRRRVLIFTDFCQAKFGEEHGMNAFYVNKAVSINWWASLVPAAAVIPAPVAYADVVDVKTLVVDCNIGKKWTRSPSFNFSRYCSSTSPFSFRGRGNQEALDMMEPIF